MDWKQAALVNVSLSQCAIGRTRRLQIESDEYNRIVWIYSESSAYGHRGKAACPVEQGGGCFAYFAPRIRKRLGWQSKSDMGGRRHNWWRRNEGIFNANLIAHVKIERKYFWICICRLWRVPAWVSGSRRIPISKRMLIFAFHQWNRLHRYCNGFNTQCHRNIDSTSIINFRK